MYEDFIIRHEKICADNDKKRISFASLWWLVMLSIFHMSLGPLYVFLREVSVQVLCPFFNWVVCPPGVESCEFFIYFGDETLIWGIISKCIFPYCWFSFHFAIFFSHAESFYFDEVPFVYSFLYVSCFRRRVCEDVAVWRVLEAT